MVVVEGAVNGGEGASEVLANELGLLVKVGYNLEQLLPDLSQELQNLRIENLHLGVHAFALSLQLLEVLSGFLELVFVLSLGFS